MIRCLSSDIAGEVFLVCRIRENSSPWKGFSEFATNSATWNCIKIHEVRIFIPPVELYSYGVAERTLEFSLRRFAVEFSWFQAVGLWRETE